jgi:predicted nucleic acid-binding protein
VPGVETPLPRYLADKSALTRRETRPEVREVVEPLLLAGRIATCGIIDLELLFSATSPAVYAELALVLRSLPRVPVTEAVVDRALEVQALLAEGSQHRAVPLPDLLVAACAETAGLIVLHYDADFERIAAITGQSARWVLPRGSVS